MILGVEECSTTIRFHTVKKGDNLTKIAQKYDMTLFELLDKNKYNQNGIKNPNLIYPGDIIMAERTNCKYVTPFNSSNFRLAK